MGLKDPQLLLFISEQFLEARESHKQFEGDNYEDLLSNTWYIVEFICRFWFVLHLFIFSLIEITSPLLVVADTLKNDIILHLQMKMKGWTSKYHSIIYCFSSSNSYINKLCIIHQTSVRIRRRRPTSLILSHLG